MPFKVLSVFANAGLPTDDEIYVVSEIGRDNVAREIFTTRESELHEGHDARTLLAAVTLAWRDVRAPRHGTGEDAHWQLQVKRHAAFDGGLSGWENGDRIYASQGKDKRDQALLERRMRHFGYLMALDPRHLEKYMVKDALNKAASVQQAGALEKSVAVPASLKTPTVTPPEAMMAVAAASPLVLAEVWRSPPEVPDRAVVAEGKRAAQNPQKALRPAL